MARRYEWPDPKDRSPNQPETLLEREAVIDLYRQGTGDESAKYLTESIKRWFEEEAKKRGWDSVTWVNQKAVLKKTWS
jgi:hypothetical protein